MLPSSYPYDRRQLAAAWTTFVQSGAFPATPLDPAVKRSWLACRDAGFNPEATPQPEHLHAEALEARRQSCFDLIAAARPFMEDVYQFSGESDMIVYLTEDALSAFADTGHTSGQRA
jgi:transcriptional regulator of acetoin/glycerol metabolism